MNIGTFSSIHIQQYTNEWDASQEVMVDIARRRYVSFFYPSAYACNYSNDPGEIDAEIYAIEQSLKYFKSDSIIAEKEAKEILFELMVSDDYYNKQIFNRRDVNSINDVITVMKEHRDTCVLTPYPIIDNIPAEFEDSIDRTLDMTKIFLQDSRFTSHREAISIYQNGRTQDKILEQTVVVEHPEYINKVKTIRQELIDYKTEIYLKQMTGDNTVILPSEIEEIEFTTAVQSIKSNGPSLEE